MLSIFLLASATAAQAEIAVIVHASNPNDTLSANEVSRIFLGKTKKFPAGSRAIPVNQDEGRAIKDTFNKEVCGKSSSSYKSYWSKLVFTGKGTPPKDSGDDAEVKQLVAANPNIIGYIDASQVDSSVKVVFTLP